MPQVTAVEPQKKNKDRFNIYVDGEFALGVSGQFLVKYKIKSGREISADKLAELKQKKKEEKYFDLACSYLSYRPRSEKEIRDYLKKKGIDEVLCEEVLGQLRDRDYVDDHEFAVWWVEQRNRFRPRGKYALKMELGKKGIAKNIIEQVLEAQVDEFVLARQVAKKKRSRYQDLDYWDKRKKLKGFLSRRGFSWEAINEVLDELEES